jgi:hypothetical protein
MIQFDDIKVHETTDETLYSLLNERGIVVFYGGRLEVRKKLARLSLKTENNDDLVANHSINHKYTDVGYGYDRSLFEKDEIIKIINKYFDRYL